MKKKPDTREQIWTALFLVTPVIILSKLSDEFADSSLNRLLFAGLFGGLGGLLGAGLLHLITTKTTLVKTVIVLLLIGLCVTTLIVATRLNKPYLQACEKCGYIAITSDKKECGYCGTLN